MKKFKSAKLFRLYPEWFCVQYKCSMDTTRVFCEDRIFNCNANSLHTILIKMRATVVVLNRWR